MGWSQFTWAGNAIDVNARFVRLAVLGATVTGFFMAQGVPNALTTDGEWFSVPFGLTMAIGLAIYWVGLAGQSEHQRALVTYVPVAGAGAVLAMVAGFLGDAWQEWAYGAVLLLLVASGLTAQAGTPFHVYPKHFAERHGLIVIIALGESIIAVGVGSAGLERTGEFFLAVAVGAAFACILWWAYFDWFTESAERALSALASHGRARLARDVYTYLHFPIVLGIVGVAVGLEEIIAHPDEPMNDYARLSMGGGLALYLLAIAAAECLPTGDGMPTNRLGKKNNVKATASDVTTALNSRAIRTGAAIRNSTKVAAVDRAASAKLAAVSLMAS